VLAEPHALAVWAARQVEVAREDLLWIAGLAIQWL
jgi:hypothetical protein